MSNRITAGIIGDRWTLCWVRNCHLEDKPEHLTPNSHNLIDGGLAFYCDELSMADSETEVIYTTVDELEGILKANAGVG